MLLNPRGAADSSLEYAMGALETTVTLPKHLARSTAVSGSLLVVGWKQQDLLRNCFPKHL